VCVCVLCGWVAGCVVYCVCACVRETQKCVFSLQMCPMCIVFLFLCVLSVRGKALGCSPLSLVYASLVYAYNIICNCAFIYRHTCIHTCTCIQREREKERERNLIFTHTRTQYKSVRIAHCAQKLVLSQVEAFLIDEWLCLGGVALETWSSD
jgi:hypothetical protein